MSYPQTVDEMPEEQLRKELAGRQEARQQGLCDYCLRNPLTSECKFPDRHHDKRIKFSVKSALDEVFRTDDVVEVVLPAAEAKRLEDEIFKSSWAFSSRFVTPQKYVSECGRISHVYNTRTGAAVPIKLGHTFRLVVK